MVCGSEGLGERSAQYNAVSALPPFQLQIRTAASGQASGGEREEQQQHPLSATNGGDQTYRKQNRISGLCIDSSFVCARLRLSKKSAFRAKFRGPHLI
jgi:hypothetical protein